MNAKPIVGVNQALDSSGAQAIITVMAAMASCPREVTLEWTLLA